jgi:hypothetical protein
MVRQAVSIASATARTSASVRVRTSGATSMTGTFTPRR